MEKLTIKKIGTKWIFSTISLIFVIVGTIIGFFTFLIFPGAGVAELGFGAKLLAWLIFIILYTLIMVISIFVIVILYNTLSPKTGGMTFIIEKESLEE